MCEVTFRRDDYARGGIHGRRARATNGLKTQKLRGDRLVNCLQVEDGGRAAHIKEIIANAAVSRATALFASEMSKTVFDMDPFTEAVPTGG